MTAPLDLPDLVTRIVSGDPAAENALIEHFAPRVRAMTLARTRDADLARDLTQESLIAVLIAARKGQIRDLERVAAFVCGVARNIINNHRRRVVRLQESPLEDELLQSGLPGLMTNLDHEEADRMRQMTRALTALGQADREVLLLTLVDGLKPGEIAARTGLTPDVVRTRKSRALKRVLEEIDRQSQNPAVRHLIRDASHDL
jgi:RNA polymerase sigma-70 factor (ECF subfamily)